MLRLNILHYLTKMLRQYFHCNEILEIFLKSFCNILGYVGPHPMIFVEFLVNAFFGFRLKGLRDKAGDFLNTRNDFLKLRVSRDIGDMHGKNGTWIR